MTFLVLTRNSILFYDQNPCIKIVHSTRIQNTINFLDKMRLQHNISAELFFILSTSKTTGKCRLYLYK